VRDGNNVNYDIDNLTSKCNNERWKTQKGKNREAEMLRVDSHAWAASSVGAYRNTTPKMDEKVKIVNYIRWLSIVIR